MGKHAQLVMGPAGTGKSTYCATIQRHCESSRRSSHVVNLDPAAEVFDYTPSIDIRDLISVDDVMTELDYGPNGGLVYCLEYLGQNLDWLLDELGEFDDDYLILDCPGQIELYTHIPVMRTIVDGLRGAGYSVCAMYLLDSSFLADSAKFMAGALAALSCMVQLELPHVNVLTKCDLLKQAHGVRPARQRKKRRGGRRGGSRAVLGEEEDEDEDEEDEDEEDEDEDEDEEDDERAYDSDEADRNDAYERYIERFLDVDVAELVHNLHKETGSRFYKLNEAFASLLEDWGLVSFVPLDVTDQDSIETLLLQVDAAMQYGEDTETNTKRLDAEERNEDVDLGDYS